MHNQKLIDLFVQLAKIEGLSKNEREVADFVTHYLRELGLSVIEDGAASKTGGNCGNIIAQNNGGGNVVLMSHMDTARPTINLNPVISEDRITSDGSTILGADNRAGIAAILAGVERIVAKNKNHSFTVAFTVCEETTLGGSQYIQFEENIKAVFIFDSSKSPGQFIYKSYGAKYFEIEIIGKAAHAGIAPETGISSIEVVAHAISKLNLGRIDKITTANIGTISGGTATNVVAEKTFLKGEIRSLNVENIENIEKEIIDCFEVTCKNFGAKIEYKSGWEFEPYQLDKNGQLILALSDIMRQCNLNPEPVITAGGSDANSLNRRGIPSVNIGIGAQNPHANNEFILIKDLLTSSEIAEKIILNNQE